MRNFQNSFMRPGHALHGWNPAFSDFTIHKVLPQLLQTASISAIHVQSTQSIVLEVPPMKGEGDRRMKVAFVPEGPIQRF